MSITPTTTTTFITTTAVTLISIYIEDESGKQVALILYKRNPLIIDVP